MPNSVPLIQPDWHLSLTGDPVRLPILRRSGEQVTSGHDTGTLPDESVQRLPGTVVMPAFVNAHTHLDLSSFDRPSGPGGMSLPEWLVRIIRFRVGQASDSSLLREESVNRAIEDSRRYGTAVIGNIAGIPWRRADSKFGSPRIVDFYEQLGADPNLAIARNDTLKDFLDLATGDGENPGLTGISPHAPYSMSLKLFDLTIDLARSQKRPVAMHLAESPEERQFLDHKTGPFIDVLAAAGTDPTDIEFPSIRHCIRRMAECVSALVVHGNHLTDDELDLIAQHSSRISVIWCPRTHQWFGHSPWPLQKMLQRGICVAVGTDSLASNPDLDVLAELQTIARLNPELEPRTILRLGTLNGLQAIGERDAANANGQVRPVMLQYSREIPDDPERAVLSNLPVQRTLLWELCDRD